MRKSYRYLAAWLMAVLFSIAANAQSVTISGTVRNGNSKEGIAILDTQFRWFCNCNPTKQDQLYVDTHSIITAVEILFKNDNFDVSSAAAVIRWAVDHTYDSSIKEETKATIRLIPLEESYKTEGTCIYSGKPSSQRVVFARAY